MEAAAEFQKILNHRGIAPVSPLYPLSHLGLARAYALSGDSAKSRRMYQDFFALWKDAIERYRRLPGRAAIDAVRDHDVKVGPGLLIKGVVCCPCDDPVSSVVRGDRRKLIIAQICGCVGGHRSGIAPCAPIVRATGEQNIAVGTDGTVKCIA